MDYSQCSAKQLEKLSEQTFSEYYAAATRPCGDWHAGATFPELEEATRKLNEINDEIERRCMALEGGRA